MKSTQSIYIYIIIYLVLVSMLVPDSAYAASSFAVHPLVTRVTLSSHPQLKNVFIENQTNHTESFSLRINDIYQSNDDSANTLLASTSSPDLSRFLSQIQIIEKGKILKNISLSAHEREKISIAIPPLSSSNKSQDYYFAILFITKDIKDSSFSPHTLNAYIDQHIGIGTVFLISPPHALASTVSVTQNKNTTIIFTNNLNSSFTVENPNPNYENLLIQTRITTPFMNINISKTNSHLVLLAKRQKRMTITTTLPQWFVGPVLVTTGVADTDSHKQRSFQQTIFVLPLRLIIFIIIMLLAVIYVYLRIRSRLKTIR